MSVFRAYILEKSNHLNFVKDMHLVYYIYGGQRLNSGIAVFFQLGIIEMFLKLGALLVFPSSSQKVIEH